MSTEISDFEEALLSSRDDFINRHNQEIDRAREQFGNRSIKARKLNIPTPPPVERKRPSSPSVSMADKYKTGYLVRLAVRKKQLAMDEMFEFQSDKLSKLEARLDAEKAAKKAGYPIVGYVYSIDRL